MSKFKIDGELYAQRKADLERVIDFFGPKVVAAEYKERPVPTIFNLYEKIWFDRQNQDSHPSYGRGRQRILPYDETFEMYPNGSNDDHIQTMMKRALYELIPETRQIDRDRQAASPGMSA